MSGFWAGTIPPWAWVLYVAAAGIFLILVIVAELHGRKVGYRQHEEDRADARHEAAIRSWHPPEVAHEELISPAGYLRGLDRILAGTTTNLARDPDDPYDPDEDAPFTVVEEWSVPLEYPPAEPDADGNIPTDEPPYWRPPDPPAYAWEPWSLSEGTTLLEDVLAMCANAEAAPSVRWLAGLEGQ
jgi:hypothetical protein